LNAEFPGRNASDAVVYNGKIWIVGGSNSIGVNTSDVWSSVDGKVWTPVNNNAAFGNRDAVVLLNYSGKMWVITGEGNSDAWWSTDGLNWTCSQPNGPFTGRDSAGGCVFDDGTGLKMWLAGGEAAGLVLLKDVWYSSDGIDWYAATKNAAFGPDRSSTMLSYNNKMWLIAGTGASGESNSVWWSSNGADWNLATGNAAFGPRDSQNGLVYDNKMWIIGGNDYLGYKYSDVWWSTDGVNWVEATNTPAFGPKAACASVVYNNKMWLMAGDLFANDAWYSGTPAGLSSTVDAAPGYVGPNSQFTVNMCISNYGGLDAISVQPHLTPTGAGGATLVSGPAPASADIASGSTACYQWIYKAVSFGSICYNGFGDGAEQGSGNYVSSTSVSIPACIAVSLITLTNTQSPTFTISPTVIVFSPTPTGTYSPTPTFTGTLTETVTFTATKTATTTGTDTASPTVSETFSGSPTHIAGVSFTNTPADSPTAAFTATPSGTTAQTKTITPTPTNMPPYLTIEKSVTGQDPRIGAVITYEINVTNHSYNTAYDIDIWDTLPDGLEYTGGNPYAAVSGNYMKWTIAGLASNNSVEIEVQAVVTDMHQGYPIVNIAACDYAADPAYPDDKIAPIFSAAAVYPLDGIAIYPNPFDPKKAVGGNIKFLNIVPGSLIRLYTLSGELINNIKVNTILGLWDGRNMYLKPVSAGIYYYEITPPQGSIKTGKIYLVRN
jgi:uncharacterized repeat protein (TIGR01451 family)